MKNFWLLPALAIVAAAPLAAQGAVTMPSGNYYVAPRDTAKAADVAIVNWPLTLKGSVFTLTQPSDSLTFTGKLVQKDGMVTYTDQSCDQPAVYFLRQERGGYAFDLKSAGCTPAADDSWSKLLLMPGKPKKTK